MIIKSHFWCCLPPYLCFVSASLTFKRQMFSTKSSLKNAQKAWFNIVDLSLVFTKPWYTLLSLEVTAAFHYAGRVIIDPLSLKLEGEAFTKEWLWFQNERDLTILLLHFEMSDLGKVAGNIHFQVCTAVWPACLSHSARKAFPCLNMSLSQVWPVLHIDMGKTVTFIIIFYCVMCSCVSHTNNKEIPKSTWRIKQSLT